MTTRNNLPHRKLHTVARQASLISTCVALAYAAAPAALAQDAKPADSNSTLRPVTVTGERPDSPQYADPAAPYKANRLSSDKFTEPILNTPRTVTVLTKEVLEDKNATTLREIGRSTAGVTLGTGEGGNAFGDRFFIRGFDARNDIFVDGVRDPGTSIRENFFTEQIEILRGPASSFAGRGTTGGAINIVPKQARDIDFNRVDATYGFSDNTKRLTVDLNRVISPVLDVRMGAMIQSANVAGRDYTTDNRKGLGLAATLKPTAGVTVKAGFTHTELYGLPDFGVPYNPLARRPVTSGDVGRDTYYGIVNRDFTRATQNIATLDAAWKVNDQLTVENKIRAQNSLFKYIGTIPENPSAANAVTAPFSSSTTRFSGFTQLNAQSRYQPVTVLTDQAQATYKFDAGGMRHTAVAGLEISRERVSVDTYAGFTSELTTGPVAFTSTGAPIVSVTNPTNYLFGSGQAALTGNPVKYHVDTNSLYVMDTMNYQDFVILNGGLRYDDYKITSANNTSASKADSGLTSFNVGALVKPAPNASVYAAYATAATPVGSELDAVASLYGGLSPTQNPTQIFGPQKSKAAEVGTKWELFDRRLLATAALFQTNVTNARETAPANLPGFATGQVVAGAEYKVQGVDFEAAGKLTDRWSIMGGLVLMHSEVTKSIVPTNVGLKLANVAHQSFNLMSKYRVNSWFELGGQAVYASAIQGGSLLAANGGVAYPGQPTPTSLPSHWRFDTFAEAKVTQQMTLKLFVNNIFNKTYYDSFYQSAVPFVIVAPGRSATMVASFKF